MADTAVTLPWYAMPPGTGGVTPRGIHHDPATSFRLAKTLLKGMRPQLKVKGKGRAKAKHSARSAKPENASKK